MWTPRIAAAGSCRVWVDVELNQPDVDSAAQAAALIAGIEAELAAAERAVRDYGHLVALAGAHHFLSQLVDNFYLELSRGQLQSLRDGALAAGAALRAAATSCGDVTSPDDAAHLLALYEALLALGGAEDWRNPDGTTKTLEQYLGPEAAQVLETVQRLADTSNPVLHAEYRAALLDAEALAESLAARLASARAVLASWLEPPPT
jgi:hypothetical protein